MHQLEEWYGTHPSDEKQILDKLAQWGRDLNTLRPQDVSVFDQDHYGGLEATDALVERLSIGAGSYVLDIGSGLGGTSRYLAYRHGCRVVGIDPRKPQTEGAVALTRRVGLAEQVRFVQGDVENMHFERESFNAALSQEGFVHISDKESLLQCCRRVLKPGGQLGFTDWIAGEALSEKVRESLGEIIAAVGVISAQAYERLLERTGFSDVQYEDISGWWQNILHGRLEMFKALRKETVRRFGAKLHYQFIADYEAFLEQIEKGALGGGRFWGVA